MELYLKYAQINSLKIQNICLILFECLCLGEELNLAIKLTENGTSSYAQSIRYISTLMILRYGTSGYH